jgi:subtilisin family serine protease
MAAPHVTGAVAVYLEKNPEATPSEVMAALLGSANTGHLSDVAMLPGTPNKLLFTGQQS